MGLVPMSRIVHLELTIGRPVFVLEQVDAQRGPVLPSASAVQPEPVSPELVLIDPELARRERARLEEKAYLASVLERPVLTPPVAPEPAPAVLDVHNASTWRDWREAASFAKRRLVPAVLLCSLLGNGFLVAELVARRGEEAAQVAVRMVTLTQSVASAPSSAVLRSVPNMPAAVRPSTATATTVGPTTKRIVESKVVALILSAPAQKLPRDFIDPTTGLVKNNVHVVCNKRKQRSFLCAIRLPSQNAGKALYVRYRTRQDGRGVFRWYGYKRS